MEKKSYILIIFLAVMCTIIAFKHNTGFVKDIILSVLLIALAFTLYNKLRLTPMSLSILCLAFTVHDLGTFGFYSDPNLFIPYDWITHFLGIFAATIVIANFLSSSLTKSKKFKFNDSMILFIAFLAALGIGALVELLEFSGYILLGPGDSIFQLATVDFAETSSGNIITDMFSGLYGDTIGDFICNVIGALVAVILFSVNFFKFKREKV